MDTKKTRRAPPFVQIAVAPAVSGQAHWLYGLDKKGRVWVRTLEHDDDGWSIVDNELDEKIPILPTRIR